MILVLETSKTVGNDRKSRKPFSVIFFPKTEIEYDVTENYRYLKLVKLWTDVIGWLPSLAWLVSQPDTNWTGSRLYCFWLVGFIWPRCTETLFGYKQSHRKD